MIVSGFLDVTTIGCKRSGCAFCHGSAQRRLMIDSIEWSIQNLTEQLWCRKSMNLVPLYQKYYVNYKILNRTPA